MKAVPLGHHSHVCEPGGTSGDQRHAGDVANRYHPVFERRIRVEDGRVLAAVAVNRGKDLRRSIPLIKARRPMEPAKLRDAAIDLRTLAWPR